MNSDGKVDVFTSQDDAVILYMGNGDGTFSVGTSLGTGAGAIGHLEFGDLDADGTLDVLAPVWNNGTFHSFLGNPAEAGGAASPANYSSISIDVSNRASARTTLTIMGSALDSLNVFAGQLGAFQSRLDSAIRTLHTSISETTSADSRIRDLDVASGAAELLSSSIRASAASAVLVQANQQPQIALRLLGI